MVVSEQGLEVMVHSQPFSSSGDGTKLPHPSAVSAVSWASALAASRLCCVPLFLHLSSVLQPAPSAGVMERPSLPLPVLTVLAGGCGKLKFKEFCLSPLPDGSPLQDQTAALIATYQALGKLLAGKMVGAMLEDDI